METPKKAMRSSSRTARIGSARTAAPIAQVPDVAAAMVEITSIPAAEIHRAAAFTWGARAMACYRVCLSKTSLQENLSYFYLGEHYREAALAHAAMGEAWQPLHAEIDSAMVADRTRAFTAIRRQSAESGSPPPHSSRRPSKT